MTLKLFYFLVFVFLYLQNTSAQSSAPASQPHPTTVPGANKVATPTNNGQNPTNTITSSKATVPTQTSSVTGPKNTVPTLTLNNIQNPTKSVQKTPTNQPKTPSNTVQNPTSQVQTPASPSNTNPEIPAQNPKTIVTNPTPLSPTLNPAFNPVPCPTGPVAKSQLQKTSDGMYCLKLPPIAPFVIELSSSGPEGSENKGTVPPSNNMAA